MNRLTIGLLLMGLVGGWTAEPAFAQSDDASLLERMLLENVVPFWYPECIDHQDGGYRLNHDIDGKYLGPGPKGIVTQSRTLWFFSRLARSPYGKPEYLEAARHGFEFIKTHLWDSEYGGFYWSVSSDGSQPVVAAKHAYGQSFGLYGLAEYARASGDKEALELARKTATILERNAHDQKYGGYRESFARDWTPLDAGGKGQLNIAGDRKTMNTHLHLMEAFSTYYRVTRDVLVRERLLELISICSNAVVRKNLGACSDQYQLDWTPIDEPARQVVSYGHDVENVWLLMDATESAGMNDGPLVDLYRALVDYSLQHGFDRQSGGFFDLGPFQQDATARQKTWWVQAEGLVGLLKMARRTGNPSYQEAFEKTLNWVNKHQVDWKNGEWFSSIDPDGKAGGAKSGLWKSPYHNGRALLECLEVMRRPPQ